MDTQPYEGNVGDPEFQHVCVDARGERIVIRRVQEKDSEALLDMYTQFENQDYVPGMLVRAPKHWRHLVKMALAQPVNLIGLAGDEAVVHACILDIQPWVRTELEISVRPDLRGRGLGTAMLSAVVAVARQCGYHELWQTVDSDNASAIGLYSKFGFVFVGGMSRERDMVLKLRKEKLDG
ncbi:GNAT family N-acetyltransferase [Thermodesulfobacteriota bacterium]